MIMRKNELVFEASVGRYIQVAWSNGAGYSVYRVEDSAEGPHVFVLVEEVEFGG